MIQQDVPLPESSGKFKVELDMFLEKISHTKKWAVYNSTVYSLCDGSDDPQRVSIFPDNLTHPHLSVSHTIKTYP